MLDTTERWCILMVCLVILTLIGVSMDMSFNAENDKLKINPLYFFLENNPEPRIVPLGSTDCIFCAFSNRQPVCLWHYKTPDGNLYDGYAMVQG